MQTSSLQTCPAFYLELSAVYLHQPIHTWPGKQTAGAAEDLTLTAVDIYLDKAGRLEFWQQRIERHHVRSITDGLCGNAETAIAFETVQRKVPGQEIPLAIGRFEREQLIDGSLNQKVETVCAFGRTHIYRAAKIRATLRQPPMYLSLSQAEHELGPMVKIHIHANSLRWTEKYCPGLAACWQQA